MRALSILGRAVRGVGTVGGVLVVAAVLALAVEAVARPSVSGGGLTQTLTDTLYVKLTGSTMSGSLRIARGATAEGMDIDGWISNISGTYPAGAPGYVFVNDNFYVAGNLTQTTGLVDLSAGTGLRIKGQAGTTIAAPATCDSSAQFRIEAVDDTDDTGVSYLCFCGRGADDTTYAWRRVDDPTVTCF